MRERHLGPRRFLIATMAGLVGLVLIGACDHHDDAKSSNSSSAGRWGGSSVSTATPETTPIASPPLPAGDDTVVTAITDGDTLVVAGEMRVRLIGVDAPEVRWDDCFSAEATRRLSQLVGPGTSVRLVYDIERRDRYGRTLAYLYRTSDGLFVNQALAAEGYAQALTIAPNVAHAEEFRWAVDAARQARHGLWSACARAEPPPPPAPAPTPPLPAPPARGPAVSSPPLTAAPAGECHPSYVGACVSAGVSDVDCGGGRATGRPTSTRQTLKWWALMFTASTAMATAWPARAAESSRPVSHARSRSRARGR